MRARIEIARDDSFICEMTHSYARWLIHTYPPFQRVPARLRTASFSFGYHHHFTTISCTVLLHTVSNAFQRICTALDFTTIACTILQPCRENLYSCTPAIPNCWNRHTYILRNYDNVFMLYIFIHAYVYTHIYLYLYVYAYIWTFMRGITHDTRRPIFRRNGLHLATILLPFRIYYFTTISWKKVLIFIHMTTRAGNWGRYSKANFLVKWHSSLPCAACSSRCVIDSVGWRASD